MGGTLAFVSLLSAHHEWPVDRSRQITLTGTVAGYHWSNPHVRIDLDVEANGTIEKWMVGGSSPQFMTTCGWSKTTLKPGDVITIIGYRYKDGSTAAQMEATVMPNGKKMYYGAPPLHEAQCVPQHA
jgi:hypothetical protein